MGQKKSRRFAVVYLCGILLFGYTKVYSQKITKQDFQRAEQFLPQNVDSLVFRADVNPHWTEENQAFWYRVDTRKGRKYFVVNAEDQTKKPFFDQLKLAQNLSSVLKKKIDPYNLPIHSIKWNYSDNSIQFRIDERDGKWKPDLQTLEINKAVKQEKKPVRLSSESPDGKWTVTRKDFNLWLKNNKTGKEYQLTEDGEKNQIYGASLPWASTRQILPVPAKDPAPLQLEVTWSENSKNLYANKLDLRQAQKLYLLKNVPEEGFRSQVFSYYRALPGEDSLAKVSYNIFDIKSKGQTSVQIKPYDELPFGKMCQTHAVGKSDLYFICRERGYGSVTLLKINTETGEADSLFHQTSDTYIDPLKRLLRKNPIWS